MPSPVLYSLKFAIGGDADPTIFTNLDKARDVAFGVAEELGLDINIVERFGQSETIIEVIEGFEG